MRPQNDFKILRSIIGNLQLSARSVKRFLRRGSYTYQPDEPKISLLQWPAALGVDDAVDICHEADRFVEGHDDTVVMDEIVAIERPSLAVFKPLLTNLVAADVEVPDLLGHATEADGSGELGISRALYRLDGVDPDSVVRPAHLVNHRFRRAGEGDVNRRRGGVSIGPAVGFIVPDGNTRLHRGFDKVEGDKLSTEPGQSAEQIQTARERQAGKVNLQELGVAGAVAGAVEHRIDVMEDVFGTEGLNMVAFAVGNKGQAETGGAILDECEGEVGATGRCLRRK